MKKLVLLMLMIGFLLFVFFPLKAQAHDVVQTLSNGRKSWCDYVEGESWNCLCQGTNTRNDCRVGNIISNPVCACCGDCTLNDFISIGTNLANLIFKYLGVAALLFFVIGGLMWITSGGDKNRIKKGKDILKNALIGLAIIIAANLIIRLVTTALGVETKYLEDDVTTTQEEQSD